MFIFIIKKNIFLNVALLFVQVVYLIYKISNDRQSQIADT